MLAEGIKMRTLFLPLAMIAAGVLCAGCRAVSTGEHGGIPSAADNDQAASLKLGDGILNALRERNYRKLRENIPGDLGEHMSEPDFLVSCRKLDDKFGKLQDFRFLTSLDTPAFSNLIWTADFVKPGANGDPIRRQLLFRVVTMRLDGKTKVVSFGFI